MSTKVSLLALVSLLILGLAGCSAETPQESASAAPATPPTPAEPPPPIYELTKDDITSHPDWTSRNISILGVKLGDTTRTSEKAFGAVENTRTLPEEYLTIYQGNGLFVYTFKLTGKLRKFEINDVFAKKIVDAKLKRLLTSGDLNYMREIFGPEEGAAIENAEEGSTAYPYDSRGFRFVKYKLGGKTVNALIFTELKKTGTT
jgi:hypothetical protein